MTDSHRIETSADSETRYQALRAAVADYHYHVQVENGRIVRKQHGHRCVAVTGYTADEYSADPPLWMAIVLEQDRSLIDRQIADLFAGGQPPAIEYRIRRRDGRIRWISKTVVPYHDRLGALVAYDGLLCDVTDRKQLEHDLIQSEERFRLIFEDDLTGDYLATPDGTILLCNQAFADIFGFSSRNEAVGTSLANLFATPQCWPEFIRLLTDAKSLERYERAGRHRDGTIRYVIETVVGTFDASGTLVRLKGYVYDDTDSRLRETRMRQRTEWLEEMVASRTRELREKHEHLQAIWNSAFDAIITIDAQGVIETINRAAETLFGYSSTELIGQNVRILMPPPFREEHDGYLRHYRETRQHRILNTPRELVARRKDGTTFPIDLSVTQVDHSELFTGIIRDRSERHELQQHVLESTAEEQRRIGLELHDGIGQELTGLSLVAGTVLDLMATLTLHESDGHKLRMLDEQQYARLCGLVTNLNQKLATAYRNVHQLSDGMMPVQIDAQALQSALEELSAATSSPPAVSCRFSCPSPVTTISNLTATHLYRIAQEAVNNAIRHGQASEICISLQQHEHQVLLEVSDNGVGIEFPGNDSYAARPRRGMGLRTMQYRAGIIGGTLHVERRDEGGTLVRCSSYAARKVSSGE